MKFVCIAFAVASHVTINIIMVTCTNKNTTNITQRHHHNHDYRYNDYHHHCRHLIINVITAFLFVMMWILWRLSVKIQAIHHTVKIKHGDMKKANGICCGSLFQFTQPNRVLITAHQKTQTALNELCAAHLFKRRRWGTVAKHPAAYHTV